MRKQPTLRTPEETEAKVAEMRARGTLPPPGKSHEYVAKDYWNVVTQRFSGIGDCVEDAFDDYAIEFSPSCSCEALKRQLNFTPVEDVEKTIDRFVVLIAANVRHAKGWRGAVLQVINWADPEGVKATIRSIVMKCIEAKRESPPATSDP